MRQFVDFLAERVARLELKLGGLEAATLIELTAVPPDRQPGRQREAVLGGAGGTSGQTYTTQQGNYIKMGPLVHCGMYMQFSAKGTITGNLEVQNLPYAGGGGSPTHAAVIGYMTNLNSGGTPNPRRSLHGYLLAASTHIALYSGDDLNNINMVPMTTADVNNTTQLIISITYNTTYG